MNSQVRVEEAQLPTMETLGSFGVRYCKERSPARRESGGSKAGKQVEVYFGFSSGEMRQQDVISHSVDTL